MNILLAGASGLVGNALLPALINAGHTPRRLVRNPSQDHNTTLWDPGKNKIEAHSLPPIDAAIILSGHSIASGYWTTKRKALLRDSRIDSTTLLANTLATLEPKPRALLAASAIGYYGNRADEILTEDASPGTGFLSDLTQEWEEATRPAQDAGIRVIHLRFGIILSPHGGTLKLMLPAFKLGIAGRLGPGAQYMSWISLPDAVNAILHVLNDNSIQGPVNIVSPTPLTNQEFTKTLGQVVHRPTFLPVPAVVLKTLLGQLGRELLLSSTRVHPQKLLDADFHFQHPTLDVALKDLLRT